MKRVAILLAILFGLAFLGTKITPKVESSTAKIEPAPPQPVVQKSLTPAEYKAQQEKMFGSEVIVAAQRAVRNTLKDPDSAQFKDVFANYTEAVGLVACGQVNAKNSFGAYTGFRAFVSG